MEFPRDEEPGLGNTLACARISGRSLSPSGDRGSSRISVAEGLSGQACWC